MIIVLASPTRLLTIIFMQLTTAGCLWGIDSVIISKIDRNQCRSCAPVAGRLMAQRFRGPGGWELQHGSKKYKTADRQQKLDNRCSSYDMMQSPVENINTR